MAVVRACRLASRASYQGRRAASTFASSGGSGSDVPTLAGRRSARSAAHRELVSQLFGYLKQTAEVRSYLKNFGAVGTERFAVIKVTGDLLHLPGEAERVASALAFMDRMGLIPVVVHGAGLFSGRRAAEVAEALRHDAQFDRQSKGLVGQERDKEAAGRRLRRKAARQAMRAARRYMSRANRALCRSLAALGVETAPMLMDAFEATVDCEVEGAGEGVVGTITRVRTDDILAAVEEGLVPVIAALAPLEEEEEEEEEDEEHESGPEEVEEEEEEEEEDNDDASLDGQALTFSTWDAAAALAKELQPLKVVILRPEGGFLRTNGSRLARISLARDFEALCPEAVIDPEAMALPPSPALPKVTSPRSQEAALLEVDDSEPLPLEDSLHLLEDAALLASTSDESMDRSSGSTSSSESSSGGRLAPDRRGSRLAASDQTILRRVAELFEASELEPGATVAVTSPQHLAEELFSERGGGTLIVRGERVLKHTSFEGIDLEALRDLLEQAFGKALPETYFEERGRRLRAVYASESLRGAAIVTEEEGIAYLDKFAVSPTAQGDKLGDDVWTALVDGEPELFWRSRSDNRVNAWYFARAHGSYESHAADEEEPCVRDGASAPSTGAWTVFWRGLPDDEVMRAVRVALLLPKTFA